MTNIPLDKLLEFTRGRLSGVNISKLARTSNISRQHIYRIKRGESRNLRIDTLICLNLAIDRINEDRAHE